MTAPTGPSPHTLRRPAPRGWWLMLVFAAGIAGYAVSFAWRGIDAFGTELLPSFHRRAWAIWFHIVFGGTALVAGALTFRHSIRRARRFREHRRWMIRSYAMILAAVSLRIQLPLLAIHFEGFDPAYHIVAWSCWVPNLLLAEWVVRRSPHVA